ncbi:MAG: hypothetical protein EWV50_04270 [Microcystis aeruginosa Ma_MB_F_20061100_S20]|uniref:Uncharacterized protein n=1 Tax=Microcystis aeruginosa Ma_MB_F_20061100_S20D TaxID=2486253 RepID=A0A552EB49_MICAE|nr:MAG: hypothetical protein EWV78_20100 [Microcystis aeruginosa Ma_MB_F_20061100_S20D]TRU42062.1 MAG: hypothetical protein EWV50_04270 [Microcystis aeruginosa Ma_MB_F_20061100_S20]
MPRLDRSPAKIKNLPLGGESVISYQLSVISSLRKLPTPHTPHPTPHTLFQVRRQEICRRSLEKNS